MGKDWQEEELEDLEQRLDPKRVGDLVEHIDWRLMYGEYGTPFGVKLIGYIVITLLGLILWRIW